AATEWKTPDIRLPKNSRHPAIACTAEELARLRTAFLGKGTAHDVVARVVADAKRAAARPPVFPPRGGQHNQWYQCDKCQLPLKTVDATHHQCRRCKKVYSGEPYDDVVFARTHNRNLANARTTAWAYAITGEKPFADYTASILLGYAERYLAYPYHANTRTNLVWKIVSGGHLFEQTLNEAYVLSTFIAPAYDLIHDSLSDADRTKIRDGLLLPMLKNIDKHKAGKNNWQTWHNAGMLAGGAVLGDAAWVRKAIAQPRCGFVDQMKVSISADGMWYENSWGYHFYTLRAMVLIAEYARRLDIDLWSHPSLQKMFSLAVHYTMADGSLPRFGDDVRSRASGAAPYVEFAYAAAKDPALVGLLPRSASWDSILFGRDVSREVDPPALASRVFRGAGHAILRTQGEAGLTAAFTFGPYGGFHGHLDKLSFVFFGHKQELGVDPGRAASQAYRLPIHKRWYKPTLSHNALLVDRAMQRPATGKLELFAANAQYAAVAARCDAASPGVKHLRLLVLTPTYLLVLDHVDADKERRFDWVYHNRGAAAHCDAAKSTGKAPSPYVGMEYVQNVRTGATDGPVRVQFPGKTVGASLTLAAAPKTSVLTGDGVGASVLDRVPMVMITRHGRQADFAAVLEAVPDKGRPLVTDVILARKDGAALVTVRHGDTADTIALTADGKLTVTSAGKTVLVGE
ncbi:heparinase II/III family protein, partial [bacterium]|nr:heparinase II/III family protein [bacterium]